MSIRKRVSKPSKKKKATSGLVNHFFLILDDSASMRGLRAKALEAFNNEVRQIRDNANKSGQRARVSLLLFGSDMQVKFFNQDVETLNELTLNDYHCQGNSTRLYDSVGKAIEMIDAQQAIFDDGASYVIDVITDGGENASTNYYTGFAYGTNYKKNIKEYIAQKHLTDRFSFIFQVPRGSAYGLSSSLGVPAGNITEWDQTEEGIERTYVAKAAGLSNYHTSRSLGFNSVQSFYATANLGDVTAKAVENKLDDVSDKFKEYPVRDQAVIKDFVENRTRRQYVIGQAYYQLMKTETVQPNKKILIKEKGKDEIWAGEQARKLAKIPIGTECKLTPGNLGNWDVYIQSTSPNRILSRGTKVLVDITKRKDSTPTWK